MRKPTLEDVAALAGVGRSTVSRVLNDGPNASETVKKKVMQAVEMLGYEVNMQARLLAGGAGQQVVLVHVSDYEADPNSYYHAGLELGALRACSEKGFQLLTQTVPTEEAAYTATLTGMIQSGRCDILLLTPPLSDDKKLIQKVQKLGCPVVAISAGQDAQAVVTSIGLDDEQAGYDLTKHLIGQGHKRIAFLLGIEGHCSADERFQGFCRAHEEAALKVDDALVRRGDFTFRTGVDLAVELLELCKRPTALMCGNDDMAAGALLSAHKMGLRIPEDISVTGFDDTPMSRVVWPPLTTVHQPVRGIGYQAVELAIGLMKQDQAGRLPQRTVAPHQVVCRDSVAILN